MLMETSPPDKGDIASSLIKRRWITPPCPLCLAHFAESLAASSICFWVHHLSLLIQISKYISYMHHIKSIKTMN